MAESRYAVLVSETERQALADLSEAIDSRTDLGDGDRADRAFWVRSSNICSRLSGRQTSLFMLVLYDPDSGDLEVDNLRINATVGPFASKREAHAWKRKHTDGYEFDVFALISPSQTIPVPARKGSGRIGTVTPQPKRVHRG